MTGCELSETQTTIAMVLGMLPAIAVGLAVFGRSLRALNNPANLPLPTLRRFGGGVALAISAIAFGVTASALLTAIRGLFCAFL